MVSRSKFLRARRRCGGELAQRAGSLPGSRFVAHKRQLLAVRRPRRDIDRPLAANNFARTVILLFVERHQPQRHVFIFGMPGDALVIRENHHPLSVLRKVRKPVVVIVARDLRLLAAIGRIRQICMIPVRTELK